MYYYIIVKGVRIKMLINITIEGTNSMLLHKYTVASVRDTKTRIVSTNDAKNYSDEWIAGTYWETGKGINVVMPSENLMACFFNGSKGMKKGKTALTRVVYSAMIVLPFEPYIMYENKPITKERIIKNDWFHTCGAVISGRRVDRIRTMIPECWKISFQIKTKDESLNFDDIKKIVDNAGTSAGLGDWRPSSPKKPGSHGTFKVIQFEEAV